MDNDWKSKWEGRWDDFKGKVREKWSDMTDEDMDVTEGDYDTLATRVGTRTGETDDSIRRSFGEW